MQLTAQQTVSCKDRPSDGRPWVCQEAVTAVLMQVCRVLSGHEHARYVPMSASLCVHVYMQCRVQMSQTPVANVDRSGWYEKQKNKHTWADSIACQLMLPDTGNQTPRQNNFYARDSHLWANQHLS